MTPQSEWARICKELAVGPSDPLQPWEARRYDAQRKQKDAEAWNRIQRPPQRDLFQGE